MYKINKKTILVIIIFLIIFSRQISNAKYVKTEIIKVNQAIATPIIEIEEGDSIKINNTNRIGEYKFVVKNFNVQEISEINLIYTIEILINSDLEKNAKFKLYNNESEVELVNLKTKPILIGGNQKNENNYRLQMDYTEVEECQNLSGEIQIKINVEQEQQ